MKNKIKFKVEGYECGRCNHKWIPRKEYPIVCPKCKNPYWDKIKSGRNNSKRKTNS